MKRTTFKRVISIILLTVIMLSKMQVTARAYDVARLPATDYSLFTTAAIDEEKNLWVWSVNPGNGTRHSVIPTKVLENVISYSRGCKDTSAAITADGNLWMWGDNSCGQLGNGATTESLVPVKVMSDVVAVSCSLDEYTGFTAAIKKDGSLWTWGCAYSGRLGNGKRGYDVAFLPPQKIMTGVSAVSCGEGHAAAIKNDGSLWTWGTNGHEQLGYKGPNSADIPDTGRYVDQYEATPKKVMDDVACVSCGYDFTAVVKKDGSLWTFGGNVYGRLGIGVDGNALQNSYEKNAPKKIMDDVRTVSCGGFHMAIVKNDGSLWTCGSNHYGALGNGKWALTNMVGEIVHGDGVDINTPVKIMEDVVDVSCEYYASIALKKDGSYWTWGVNYNGELGYPDGEIAWSMSSSLGGEGGGSYIQSVPRQAEYPFTPKRPRGRINIANFLDVFIEDYYADSVQWAVKNNITSGISATRFSPSSACTRGQIVTFLWRAAGSPEPGNSSNPFVDVTSSDYFYKPVLWAVDNNITSGTDATHFSPDTSCTRSQAVTFLWRSKGMPSGSTGSFSDVPANSFYKRAVDWAVSNGITSGTGKGRFSPESVCTRGQIVTFLHRAVDVPKADPLDSCLQAYASFLRTYEAHEKDATPKFQLIYLDDNDIPELIIADWDIFAAGVQIFTYQDGQVKRLETLGENDETRGFFGHYGNFMYAERQSVIKIEVGKYDIISTDYFLVNKDTIESVNKSFQHEISVPSEGKSERFLINSQVVTQDEYESQMAQIERGCSFSVAGYHTGANINESNIQRALQYSESIM